MSTSTHDILYLQSSVITALHTKCNLSQSEVTNIIEKAKLLELIGKNYELYHIESIYNILEDIQDYVKDFGFTFKIKYNN